MRQGGKFARPPLRKNIAARREANLVRLPEAVVIHRFKDRFRLHHHAGSAAIRLVIDRTVPVMRKITHIVDVDADEARILRSPDYALG